MDLCFLSFVHLDYNKVSIYNNFDPLGKENYLPSFDFSKGRLRKQDLQLILSLLIKILKNNK